MLDNMFFMRITKIKMDQNFIFTFKFIFLNRKYINLKSYLLNI